MTIETVAQRRELGLITEMPFPDHRSGIAARFQRLRDGDLGRRQSPGGIRKEHAAAITIHASAHGQPSGEQRRAARGANGVRGIEIREAQPLGRHPIQMRRTNRRMPIATEIAVAEIIAEYYDNVRRPIGRGGKMRCRKKGDEETDVRSAATQGGDGMGRFDCASGQMQSGIRFWR